MRTYIKFAYRKALKVIDSCENVDHIDAARNYVNNFFKTYSDPASGKFGPFSLVEASDSVILMYDRLFLKLEDKERKLGE